MPSMASTATVRLATASCSKVWKSWAGGSSRDLQTMRSRRQFLAIFRCLNPSGHGTLARGDWNILQQVKQDVEQSLIECVQYLLRVSDHSWTTAWSKLDLECEDQLDRSTWQAALTRLGYHGPADVVFRYATSSSETLMTWEKFSKLEKWVTQPFDDAK
ncbi:unnamed protein product [Effrenium voratum]|uniref:Uncharacterized protein n=1 Tax=Effrenium voratum TaxID=2562239 RepID=A0AA36N6J2_9DINO|nr:unnamed protein product [Effrenium voratum]CAJ1400715.1 unnamed protein product [Effrenium voratum]